jgi:alginate O-acetyltransferase complex protein AlgI
MVFNSLTFVVFFACVLALHAMPFSWTTRKINLLIASYLFYAAWNPPFVILLWISTVVDWYAAQGLVKSEKPTARRAWMLLSVVVNLGMLGYFKYGTFMLENFKALMAAFGVDYQPPSFSIVLPVGISFYTFATLSYTLDVYLRRAAPARNFLDYALFVTFFPHLVAGPIMRPTELVPQFAEPRRATATQLRFGLALMTLGLFQKIVLADSFLSKPAEMVYDGAKIPGVVDSWIATLAFSGQIFCDFAGYSTTAIGAAMCLGFAMPDNFRFPYAAVGFSDFWRRWHITLSSWLRDYLYIPLGGNRHGEARTYIALMTTMLLGGLWHGASWAFVVWGGLHGLYLSVERVLKHRFAGYRPSPLALIGLGLLTYALINITWVFFRAKSFGKAWTVLRGMFGFNDDAQPILPTVHLVMVVAIVSAIVFAHWLMRARTLEDAISRTPAPMVSAVWAAMAFAIVIAQGTGNAFIYFQF